MIGLKRYTVRLEEHNPGWNNFAKREIDSIWTACDDNVVDLQHVGSTSVAGLSAKPIVDIVMKIPNKAALTEVIQTLQRFGYIDRGDGGDNGGYLLVKESEPNVRTFHLHIVELNDKQWYHYVAFRDALRADANLKTRYQELKNKLAEEFPDDRVSYTTGKHDFIQKALKEIEKDG